MEVKYLISKVLLRFHAWKGNSFILPQGSILGRSYSMSYLTI